MQQTLSDQEFRNNYLHIYNQATPAYIERGWLWYSAARGLGEDIDKLFNLQPNSGAGILAVTSPTKSWTLQEQETIPFIQDWLDMVNFEFGDDPRNLADKDKEQAIFLAPQACGAGYNTNKIKAAHVYCGNFDAIRGPKVSMFYQNILGNYDVITLDRHMFSSGLGYSTVLPERKLTELSRKNHPDRLAMERAIYWCAKYLNLPPAIFQAVIWICWKALNLVDIDGQIYKQQTLF